MLEKKRAHNYGAGNSANVNVAAERGDLAAGGTAHAARALIPPPQSGFPVFGGGGGWGCTCSGSGVATRGVCSNLYLNLENGAS